MAKRVRRFRRGVPVRFSREALAGPDGDALRRAGDFRAVFVGYDTEEPGLVVVRDGDGLLVTVCEAHLEVAGG